MFSRSFVRVAVVVLVVMMLPVAVFAQSKTIDRIVSNGELRVGTSGSQPPFSVRSKEGDLMGYEIDLARLIAKAMDVEVAFVEKPFGELLTALAKGEVDVVMSGMTMTPERNKRFAFVGPYLVSGKSILTKSITLSQAAEADDINRSNINIVALGGSTSEKFVQLLLPDVKLTTTADYDAAVEMVRDDRADAMVADFPICALSALRYPDDNFATLVTPLTIEPIGMAVPPNDPLLLNMIENYLVALDMSGLLEELEVFWFEQGSWLVRLP